MILRKKFMAIRNGIAVAFFALGGLLVSVFSWPFKEPLIKEQLSRLYYPKDSININKEIINPLISNAEPPKLIFAFDNSGEGLEDYFDDRKLIEEYEKYCLRILEFFSSELTSGIISNESKKYTYSNYLKARLCFDLIQKLGQKGEFRITKIGDPTNPTLEDKANFLLFNESNIQSEIIRLYKIKGNEKHTDFGKLKAIAQDYFSEKNTALSKYALYIYSDFHHDIEGVESKDDIDRIKTDKINFYKNIVLNCFIDNHQRKRRGGEKILDSLPNSNYEKHFPLDIVDIETKVPVRIVETENQFWFYKRDFKKNIETEMRLLFNREENSICLVDNKIEGLSINGEALKNGIFKHFNYDTLISLIYKGKDIPKEATFEIVHNNIHYFVRFLFFEEWNRVWKILLPIIAFLIGIIIGIWGIFDKQKIDNP